MDFIPVPILGRYVVTEGFPVGPTFIEKGDVLDMLSIDFKAQKVRMENDAVAFNMTFAALHDYTRPHAEMNIHEAPGPQ